MEEYDSLQSIRELDLCRHRKTGELVMVNQFYNNGASEGYFSSSFIDKQISEIQKLDHPNVAGLKHVWRRGPCYFLAYEYLQYTLSTLIKNRQDLVKDDQSFRKNILKQMLQAVKYFHEQGVIHQELRPEYVLVDLDSNTVKLAYIGETFRGDKGPYELGSLSYKAPEYVFGPGNFSTPFTVWSVGCSFVEMITGKPLFDCNDPLLLGGRILRFLCQSNSEGQTKSSTSNKPGDWRANLQFKNLTEEFPGLEPAEVDLLSKMLRFHPDERITIEDALEHEYFNDFQA